MISDDNEPNTPADAPEPEEFLPTWDLPAGASLEETPSAVCPLCQALRGQGQSFCGDCGYVFPPEIASAETVAPQAPPALVREQYEIGVLLAERDGVTRYLGRDIVTGGAVVIVRAPQVAESAALWPSIEWEKQLLDRAQHPSLAAVLDRFSDEGWEYLIEELPAGQTLWDAWDEPAATQEQRYFWLKQVAEALHQLHDAGALLEALRPDMVRVTPAGQARLAVLTDLLPLPLPQGTPVRGSLYTAPELVLADDQADARANLYSFGGLLYSLLVGRELTETDFERVGVPKPFLSVFPDSHPLVGRLLMKTFRRAVADRFPTNEAANEDPSGFRELIHTLDICRRTLDTVRLEIAAWTTTGLVRAGNEDAFALLHVAGARQDDLDDSVLVLLADGMGGSEAGEVAAALAIQTVRHFLLDHEEFAVPAGRHGEEPAPVNTEMCAELITAALKEANRAVFDAAESGTGRHGMGCTAEVVYLRGHELIVGHVGDSRTYLFQDGRLVQVTRDQTMVNRLVDLGALTLEEAETHPQRSELLQAIGGRSHVEPALYRHSVKAGDWVLICSDGLVNHFSAGDIEEMLQREATSAEMAARRLVNGANLRGGSDNTTVVAVRIY
jgi:protein phosphatase